MNNYILATDIILLIYMACFYYGWRRQVKNAKKECHVDRNDYITKKSDCFCNDCVFFTSPGCAKPLEFESCYADGINVIFKKIS